MLSLLKKKAPNKPTDRVIEVGDRSLPLKIKPHARAKRITLRIDPGGRGLSLTIPLKLPEREIDEFLEKYQGWILTKLAKFPKNNELSEGRYIKIRDQDHLIERTGKIRGITEVMQDGDANILRVSGDVPHLKRRIADFLKSEARKDLETSTIYHAEKIGCSFKSISLRDTKSRWGSCSSDGRLSYSWRIIMAPPFVLDYLAAHEVSHLVEMNHEPQFWQLCENLCPHTKDAKKWLKKNGSMLHAIDFS